MVSSRSGKLLCGNLPQGRCQATNIQFPYAKFDWDEILDLRGQLSCHPQVDAGLGRGYF